QLLAQGCFEASTNTLLSRAWLEATGFTASPTWPLVPARLLTLRNPLSEEYDTMRPSLLPGLLAALQRNLRYGQDDVFLCEVGWAHVQPEGAVAPEDRLLAAAIFFGSRWADAWNADPKWRADFYAAKGALEAVAAALYLPGLATEPGG